MGQSGKYMLRCFVVFLTLSILCCSVQIVRFSGRFWLHETTEMMAANNSFIAADCRLLAAEIKQFLLHKLQIQNSQVCAVFGEQKIAFSGSLWQLDFLSAYGSFMALLW